jgi:hypothetical protein
MFSFINESNDDLKNKSNTNNGRMAGNIYQNSQLSQVNTTETNAANSTFQGRI